MSSPTVHPSHPDLPSRVTLKIKINPITGCWEWTGALDKDGYGQVAEGPHTRQCHRYVYAKTAGRELGPGECVRHLCHNRRCVCPDHLTTGTHQDNMRDRVESGRKRRAYFTAHEIWTMRDLHYRSGMPLAQIAALHSCSIGVIRDAVEGESYGWAPHPRDYRPGFSPRFSDDGRRVLYGGEGEPDARKR